jgi:hypothetical protein
MVIYSWVCASPGYSGQFSYIVFPRVSSSIHFSTSIISVVYGLVVKRH